MSAFSIVVVLNFHIIDNDDKDVIIHKEKTTVTDDKVDINIYKFKEMLISFSGIRETALTKGLGENLEITMERVHRKNGIFAIKTQSQWEQERAIILKGEESNSFLQINVINKITSFTKKSPLIQIVFAGKKPENIPPFLFAILNLL